MLKIKKKSFRTDSLYATVTEFESPTDLLLNMILRCFSSAIVLKNNLLLVFHSTKQNTGT